MYHGITVSVLWYSTLFSTQFLLQYHSTVMYQVVIL